MKRNPVDGIRLEYDDSDIMTMEAFMDGPADSPYEDGIFKLEIRFPSEYPFKPPESIYYKQ